MTEFLGKGGGAEARRNANCRSAEEKLKRRTRILEELEEEPENQMEAAIIASSELRTRVKEGFWTSIINVGM